MKEKAMKNILRGLGALLLVVAAAGCHKPDFGTFNFADSSRLEVSGTFENSDGAETIKEFRVILDGTTMQDTVFSAPATRLTLVGRKYGSGSGDHQLTLLVVDQTATPSFYVTSGMTVISYDAGGAVVQRLALEPRAARLGTGEAISYAFRL
jgi:hypothetical protein